MKKVEMIRVTLIMITMGIWQPLAAANVELTNLVGASKKKVIVPFAENEEFPKVGQKVQISIKVKPEFSGHVLIRNDSLESIDLWTTSNDSGASLSSSFEIRIEAGQLQLGPLTELGIFYIKGLVEDENAKITAELHKDGDGFKHKAEINVASLAIGLREVTFSGNGGGYIPLTHDDGTAFPGANQPHWQDDGDGSPEINYSAAYIKSSVAKIGAKVKIASASNYTNKKLMATSSLNPVSVPSSDLVDEGDMAKLDPVDSGNWPGIIKLFTRSNQPGRPSFKLTWKMQIDGGALVEFAKSNHQIYITHAAPALVNIKRESLFLIACDHADSMATDMNIVSSINSYFQTRSMCKIDPAPDKGFYDGTFLTYYGSNPLGNHILEHGNGLCGSWGEFWADVVNVHGYGAVSQNVRASGFTTLGTPSSNPRAGGRKTDEFILKNNIVPILGGPLDPSSLTDDPLCQGGPSARHGIPSWPSHCISKVALGGTTYYVDPSYGTSMVAGLVQFSTLLAGFFADTKDYGWAADGVHSDINEF